eukprot:gnl/TRDRNA2_/TRDRNA2_125168_c0_seq2.p2 gnl/TRDRNA2_/TRDRNA2_125168_c0~~gnl/TRDRNA2_/TRDRNA2_125168_c0_seq2.p2  ORF type:complete len:145 (-),score=11.53 gnl/TRDRNA2_/TRDRNA2_125168_c0_seq2:9-443(-)
MAYLVVPLFALSIALGNIVPNASLRVVRDSKADMSLDAQSRKSHPPVDVNAIGHMFPDGRFWCFEGQLELIREATRKFKSGPLAKYHEKTEALPGKCAEHGFSKAVGLDGCFKNLGVFSSPDNSALFTRQMFNFGISLALMKGS